MDKMILPASAELDIRQGFSINLLRAALCSDASCISKACATCPYHNNSNFMAWVLQEVEETA